MLLWTQSMIILTLTKNSHFVTDRIDYLAETIMNIVVSCSLYIFKSVMHFLNKNTDNHVCGESLRLALSSLLKKLSFIFTIKQGGREMLGERALSVVVL